LQILSEIIDHSLLYNHLYRMDNWGALEVLMAHLVSLSGSTVQVIFLLL